MKYPVNLLIFATVTAVFLYLISPVLPPFVVGAFFAWLLNPLVERLVRWKWPRWLAVALVFFLFVFFFTVLLLLAVPRISAEVTRLIHQLPAYLHFIQRQIPQALSDMIPMDRGSLQNAIAENGLDGLKTSSVFLGPALKTVFHSGARLAVWVGNLILVPVVALYLLYDWNQMLASIKRALPQKYAPTLLALARQGNDVLAAFFRGQLLVMLTLGIIYSVGLTLLGLQTGLLIGVMIGVLAIIPYLGVVLGLVLACMAAWLQDGTWQAVLPVLIFFAVIQTLDGMFITPRLVGHRIGLHPVLVIMAVLAGGAISGFTGVVVALPVAALLRVWFDFFTRRRVLS